MYIHCINQYDTDLKKKRVIVFKIDNQWQADLVDMQKNKSQIKILIIF